MEQLPKKGGFYIAQTTLEWLKGSLTGVVPPKVMDMQ
jgi:hypothetical protein